MDKNKIQALQWLKAASDDLDSISYIIKVEHLTNIVAFHSQQTIEKSFKALIEYNKISFMKTHNLEKLYKSIEDIIEIDCDHLALINELYIDSRYPGDMGLMPHGKPTLEDAKEFYEFAESTFDKVCKILDIDKREVMR
ncbi:MAG TPA: HEPN domain-containing protein [Arcobacter sp.]|nr:HEPN domain-containing protein [Arcobacter sp.]